MKPRSPVWAALTLSIFIIGLGSAQAQSSAPAESPIPESTDSASAEDVISTVPLFARSAADGISLHVYTVPIHVTARVRKFVFNFRFSQNGQVAFEEPNHLSISIESVPARYANIFTQLGTPRTWPMDYDLHLRGHVSAGGRDMYELTGVPREPSDVDQIVIRTSEESQPVEVQWILHDGWTINSTIELEAVENYLVPRRERAVITGHGFKITCEMLYGDYTMNGESIATR